MHGAEGRLPQYREGYPEKFRDERRYFKENFEIGNISICFMRFTCSAKRELLVEWFRDQPTALLKYDPASGEVSVNTDYPRTQPQGVLRARRVITWLTEWLIPYAATGVEPAPPSPELSKGSHYGSLRRPLTPAKAAAAAGAAARVAARFAPHMFGS